MALAMGILIIVAVVVILFIIGIIAYFVGIYNGLITLKNNIEKAFANIDVLLKQRYDELPKLIASVKGYMKHEKGVLEEITRARSIYTKATSPAQKAEADNMLTGALKTLFAVAENYPKLQANENFMQLQQRITGIENELADRREYYNDSVNNFNIRIESFPDMIVARMMALQQKQMFKASEAEKQDVKVEF